METEKQEYRGSVTAVVQAGGGMPIKLPWSAAPNPNLFDVARAVTGFCSECEREKCVVFKPRPTHP